MDFCATSVSTARIQLSWFATLVKRAFALACHEVFGDGISSAIDFSIDIVRQPDPKGDRVNVVLSGKFLPYKTYSFTVRLEHGGVSKLRLRIAQILNSLKNE